MEVTEFAVAQTTFNAFRIKVTHKPYTTLKRIIKQEISHHQLPLSVSPQRWPLQTIEIQMTTLKPTAHGRFTLQVNTWLHTCPGAPSPQNTRRTTLTPNGCSLPHTWKQRARLYNLQMFALYVDLRKPGLASTATRVISAAWFQLVQRESLSSETSTWSLSFFVKLWTVRAEHGSLVGHLQFICSNSLVHFDPAS